MNNNTANVWVLLGAAVVGLVSAAGVYLIEQYRQDRRRHAFTQDLARLDGQLTTLRQELEFLRQLQKERINNSLQSKPNRRKLRNSSAVSVVSTTTTDEYNSAVDLDSSDLEFYDLSSDEDVDKSALDKEIAEVDKLLGKESEYEAALKKLEHLNIKHPNNPELLWRLGKALKIKIISTSDQELRKDLITRGIEICELATALKPNSASCHKWLALLIGLRGENQPTKERILDGHLFSEHVKEALKITPDDHVLHHLLGRYAFELAKLSWIEKTLASTLFAEVPASSYQDALDYFLTAEKLSEKEWKENRLFIAKCELAIGRNDEAIEWLCKADSATNEEEEKVHEEVKTLLEKYKKR